MLIKLLILFVIGLGGGNIVAAGIYAFISLLKIIPRLSTASNTVKHTLFYEDCVTVGAVLGNLIYVFQWKMPLGMPFMIVYAVFSGLFVGCLAIALAEVLDVIPTLARRAKLKVGIPILIICTALGKGIGSLLQLTIMAKY